VSTEEQQTASFLVLLVGKLTGWNAPVGGRGDPVYLTQEQTGALAAQGIGLLTSFLPAEAAKGVNSAIAGLPRPPHASHEERLLRAGAVGGSIVSVGDSNNPPGCCVEWPGQGLVCVR
jgi:hypothetical protein